MKYRERAVTEAMRRADGFLADHEQTLAKGNEADFARAKEKVARVLADLQGYAVEQDGNFRGFLGEAAKQRKLRHDLREDWLRPIARIAARNLRNVPDFASLQMPERSIPIHGFIASARGMCSAAEAHRDALMSYGLPETFAQDLSSAIDRFEAALGQRDSHQDRRAGATKGLEDTAKEARTVLAVLDARMPYWTKGDETLLVAWQGARQIRDRPGPKSSRKEAPPPSTKDSPPDVDGPPPTA